MAITADQLIGLPLYAKRTVLMRRLPDDTSAIVRTVSPGGRIGIIFSYINQTAGNQSWYFSFEDRLSVSGNSYVSYNPSSFDMYRLKKDLDARIEEQRRRRLGPNGRAIEDVQNTVKDAGAAAGGHLITGAIIVGGLFLAGQYLKGK